MSHFAGLYIKKKKKFKQVLILFEVYEILIKIWLNKNEDYKRRNFGDTVTFYYAGGEQPFSHKEK